MSLRPSVICWMRPKAGTESTEWCDAPDRVVARWRRHQDPTEAFVHWLAPSTDTLSGLNDFLHAAVADAPSDPAGRSGTSFLLVFDGIDAHADFIEQCTEATDRLLAVLHEISHASLTPALRQMTLDVLIRTPICPGRPSLRNLQDAWLSQFVRWFEPVDGSRVHFSHIWWVAHSNVADPIHPQGITVSSQEDADDILGEMLVTWLQTDLDELLRGAPAGSHHWHAAMGCARLVFNASRVREACTAAFAPLLLTGVATASPDIKSIPVDEATRFPKADVPLAEGVKGLRCEQTLKILLRPESLNNAFPSAAPLPDLKQMAKPSRLFDEADLEEPPTDAPNRIPATVMEQAHDLLARQLYRVARNIRECRARLFDLAARRLFEHLGRELSNGSVTHLTQADGMIRAWATVLRDERDRVESVTMRAFSETAGAPEEAEVLRAAIEKLFPRTDDPEHLVPEAEPRPEMYEQRLRDALENRPLALSWLVRSFLAALATATAAGVGVAWVFPKLINIPVVGNPWFPMLLVPPIWLGLSLLELRRRRKERARALDALYIAIEKYERTLVRVSLTRHLQKFYDDLSCVIERPIEDPSSPALWTGTLTSLAEGLPWTEDFRHALGLVTPDPVGSAGEAAPSDTVSFTPFLERLRTLVTATREAAERVPAPEGSPIPSTKVCKALVAEEIIPRFPFLKAKAPTRIRAEDSPSPEEVRADWLRGEGIAKAWRRVLDAPDDVRNELAQDARAWCAANGFGYLPSVSLEAVLTFLENQTPGVLDAWRAFLEAGAHPFCPMGESRDGPKPGRARLVRPESTGDSIERVLGKFKDALQVQWSGMPCLAAVAVQGPVDSEGVPKVPFQFPGPVDDSGPEYPGETASEEAPLI